MIEKQERDAVKRFDELHPIRAIRDTPLKRVKPFWVEGYVEGCKRMTDLLEYISHKGYSAADDFPNLHHAKKFVEKFESEWDEFLKDSLLNKPR